MSLAMAGCRGASTDEDSARVYQFKADEHSSHAAILRMAGPGQGRRALDVGAWDGFLARRLTEQGWRVTAVEKDAAMAASARPHCERVVIADLNREVPPLEGAFDLIVFGDVLEHLTEPEDIFRRVTRSLAEGGRVIVSMPNVAHLSVRLLLLFGRFNYEDRGILDRTHRHFFTRRTFRKFLEDGGIAIERMEAVPAPLRLKAAECGCWMGALLRWLHPVSACLTPCWPGGLGYQFVAVGRRST